MEEIFPDSADGMLLDALWEVLAGSTFCTALAPLTLIADMLEDKPADTLLLVLDGIALRCDELLYTFEKTAEELPSVPEEAVEEPAALELVVKGARLDDSAVLDWTAATFALTALDGLSVEKIVEEDVSQIVRP